MITISTEPMVSKVHGLERHKTQGKVSEEPQDPAMQGQWQSSISRHYQKKKTTQSQLSNYFKPLASCNPEMNLKTVMGICI